MEKIELINYINAPVSSVYKALTSEEGLGQVWTRKLRVKSETGYINEFDFDEGYITRMKTIELQRNSKVVWECIESDKEWIGTVISFELLENKGITTVTLRHADWRELTDFYKWCNYNWAIFLYSLKSYCEKK